MEVAFEGQESDILAQTTTMAASSEEKGLLGAAHRPHRRYGSTTVNMKKPENIVKHRVSKQDTIQGIALRYGVTVSKGGPA